MKRTNHRLLLLALALVVSGSWPLIAQRGAQAGRGSAAPANPADWPTFGGDVTRRNSSTAPTRLTAATVTGLQRQQVTIEGVVDAGFIYLKGVQINGASHDAFFATTNYGQTFALDARDGKVLWTFQPPGFDRVATPREIANSTPTADPNRQFLYAATSDGRVVKLAIADGALVWGTPITKLAMREKMDIPLSYFQGRVIAATAGYVGDTPPYQGHIAILDAATGRVLQVWNSLCSDRREFIDPTSCPTTMSAIWGRMGVVIDPSNGDLFFATGNGPWDGKTNWADAVIHLDANAQMKGNYAPANVAELERRDQDLGSTSPVLLPGGYLAQGGKDGKIRILKTSAIAGTEPHQGGEVQVVPTPSGGQLLAGIASLTMGNATWLFTADRGGTAAWTFSDGVLKDAWKNTNPGTTPMVAGGLVYVYDATGAGLRIYQAETGTLVTTLPAGRGHWNIPLVVDDMVILGEGSGNAARGGGPGGFGGGRPGGALPGGGAPGAPGQTPAVPPPPPTPPPAQANAPAAPAAPAANTQGIINIWRLPTK